MTTLFATVCAGCAAYLLFPLHKMPVLLSRFSFRRPLKVTDDEILNFFIVFRLELESGELPIVALERSLKVIPQSHFTSTRVALANNGDVIRALQADAQIVPEILDMSLAMQLAHQKGAQLGEALQVMTSSIHERIATSHLLRSELASVRATIGVLAILPAIGLAFGSMLNAHPIEWLTSTLYGRICLLLAIGLEFLGLWWTQKLIKRALREAR